MPFPNHDRLVASFLQELGKGLLAAVETVFVLHEPVEVGMLSRLDHGPTGSAEGICDEAIVEAYALLSQVVEIGRLEGRISPVGLRLAVADIIEEIENNIGRLIRLGQNHQW